MEAVESVRAGQGHSKFTFNVAVSLLFADLVVANAGNAKLGTHILSGHLSEAQYLCAQER